MGTGIGIKFDRIREIDIRSVGQVKSGARLVAESIHRIINTSPGERPRRPNFGCRVKEVLFDPNDYVAGTLGAFYVSDALERFEPRAIVKSIINRVDPNDKNRMIVRVVFQIVEEPETTFATNVVVTV